MWYIQIKIFDVGIVQEIHINRILMYLACEYMMFGAHNSTKRIWLDNTRKNDAQGLDNPWRNCAWELDNSQLKIFALELDTSFRKIFVLELGDSK